LGYPFVDLSGFQISPETFNLLPENILKNLKAVSFERNEKIHGRNYTLGVVLEGLPEEAEERFEKNMDETLIRRVHSRDLGLHADFLKARDFTDSSLLEAFRRDGGTILLTTHYMEEAESLCDRVGIVDQGRMIALGSPVDLVASLGAAHVIEFALADPSLTPADEVLRAVRGVTEVRRQNGAVLLGSNEPHVTVPRLLAALERGGGDLAQLATHSATLEDVFVALTGRHLRDG